MMQITRTQVIGTDELVIAAWEPNAGHSATTTIDGVRVGRVGTERLPETIEGLRGADRLAAVGRWQLEKDERAYAAILDRCEALAELALTGDVRFDMGEVRCSARALLERERAAHDLGMEQLAAAWAAQDRARELMTDDRGGLYPHGSACDLYRITETLTVEQALGSL